MLNKLFRAESYRLQHIISIFPPQKPLGWLLETPPPLPVFLRHPKAPRSLLGAQMLANPLTVCLNSHPVSTNYGETPSVPPLVDEAPGEWLSKISVHQPPSPPPSPPISGAAALPPTHQSLLTVSFTPRAPGPREGRGRRV